MRITEEEEEHRGRGRRVKEKDENGKNNEQDFSSA